MRRAPTSSAPPARPSARPHPAEPKGGHTWRPSSGDLAVAVGATLFCVIGAAIVGTLGDEPDLTLLGVALLVAQCAPLVLRRRHPIPVLAVSGLATAAYGQAELPDPLLYVGVLIALATVVELCSRRSALVAWLASAGFGGLSMAWSGDSDPADVWVVLVGLVFAPLLGDRQRARNAYLDELRAANERAREHEADVRAARMAERAHLARELHDVVAHHVSMIVVQAEAGASLAAVEAERPASADVDAFDAIATTGRRTLNELRTLLGVLRTESTPRAPTAPPAGVDQVEDLVGSVRATGLDVTLTMSGRRRPLPPAIDLSAYRVVQEGLTNVLKHAGAHHAAVELCFGPHRLRVRVLDDGSGRPAPGPGGHGLDGLRERVSVLGGDLVAAPRPEGGFELDVSLPVPA